MKKVLLLILLFPLFYSNLKADLGSCVVYHAKFYLKNGTVFNGCFEFSGYFEEASLDEKNTNRFCNDKGVFELLKKKQREYYGLVVVYKNLYYVEPLPMRKRQDEEPPQYGFVTPSDIVLLDSSDIVQMIFWSAEYSKRYWLTSEIITGTTEMLDTLRHKKYWNSLVFTTEGWESDTISFQEYIDGPYGGYALYNYNPQINVAELKRLVHLKFPVNYEAITREFNRKHKIKEGQEWTPKQRVLHEEAINRKMQSIKEWFWKKGIVLVAVNGTC